VANCWPYTQTKGLIPRDGNESRLITKLQMNPDKDVLTFEQIRLDCETLSRESDGLAVWDAYMETLLEEWSYEGCKRWLRWGKGLAISNAGQAWVALVSGDMYRHWRDLDNAERAYQRALTLWQEQNAQASIAITYNNLGLTYQEGQRYEEAETMFNAALTLETSLQKHQSAAKTRINLGNVYRQQGQWERALAAYHQVIKDSNLEPEASFYNNLGTVYEALEKWQEAEDAYLHAVDLLDTREDGFSIEGVRVLSNVAQLNAIRGSYEDAVRIYQKALEICDLSEDAYTEATTWNNLATVHHDYSNIEEAISAYEQALELHRRMGNRPGIATVLNNLGACYDDAQRYEEAIEVYQRSLTIADETTDAYALARTYSNLGVTYRHVGDYQNARSYYERAATTFASIGNTYHEATTLANLCFLLWRELEIRPASEYWQRAWDLAQTYGHFQVQRHLASLQADYWLLQAHHPATAATWYATTLRLMQQNEPGDYERFLSYLSGTISRLLETSETTAFAAATIDAFAREVEADQEPRLSSFITVLRAQLP
jgi:tetratricopeptide (TPR) repeat protein